MSFIGDLVGSNTNQVNNVANPGFDPSVYADNGNQAQVRGQQLDFANALQAQANGQGPSASQTMLAQALQQQSANANAMAMGNRGVNPGLAMRQAEMAQGQAAQQTAAQGVLARQQEQQNAQAQLGTVLNQTRGQDIQNALGYNQLGEQYAGLNTGIAQQNAKNNGALVGGILGAGATAGVLGSLAGGGGSAGATGGGGSTGVVGGGGSAAGASSIMEYHGGRIPGRAAVPGDSPKNDTVPVMLSPGEIVVPKSKAGSPDRAKEFINQLMKNSKKRGDDGEGYGKVLAAHRQLQARVKALETQVKGKARV